MCEIDSVIGVKAGSCVISLLVPDPLSTHRCFLPSFLLELHRLLLLNHLRRDVSVAASAPGFRCCGRSSGPPASRTTANSASSFSH